MIVKVCVALIVQLWKSVIALAARLARGIQIAIAPAFLYEDLTAFIENLVSLTDLMVVKSEDRELNTNIASPSSPSLELKHEGWS